MQCIPKQNQHHVKNDSYEDKHFKDQVTVSQYSMIRKIFDPFFEDVEEFKYLVATGQVKD